MYVSIGYTLIMHSSTQSMSSREKLFKKDNAIVLYDPTPHISTTTTTTSIASFEKNQMKKNHVTFFMLSVMYNIRYIYLYHKIWYQKYSCKTINTVYSIIYYKKMWNSTWSVCWRWGNFYIKNALKLLQHKRPLDLSDVTLEIFGFILEYFI